MENKLGKINWAQMLFFSGLYLVSFVFFNMFITSALLIVKCAVSGLIPVVSAAAAGVLTWWLGGREQLKGGERMTAVLLPLLVIVLCVAVSGLIFDRSYDGNYYHKVAIGSLANGWNPMYEGLMEFQSRAALPMPLSPDDCLWAEHYAKASYFFAAPMYALTGNIEAGKAINLISLLALFFMWSGYLLHKGKHPLFVLVFGAVMVSCPVFTTQMFTNYIDLLVGIYLFLIILVFFVFEEEHFLGRGIASHWLLFAALCVMINIKFSSFGYAGLFCLGYYVWYLYRVWKKELTVGQILPLTATAAAAVAVGVLVIGLSVYGKNFLDHGHPFYPLFGEGKMDIMTINQPVAFAGMSALEKFFYATFSYAENIDAAAGTAPVLKIPFMITTKELQSLPAMDLRISGYGVWFGGILIVCALTWIWSVRAVFRKDRTLFILTAIPLGITLVMVVCLSEAWWARYFPQLYLLPLFVLLYLQGQSGKGKRAVVCLLTALLLVNNGLSFATSSLFALRQSSAIGSGFAQMEQAMEAQPEGTVVLKPGEIRGALYNALDVCGDRNVHVVLSDKDSLAEAATAPAYLDFVYWGIVDEELHETDAFEALD